MIEFYLFSVLACAVVFPIVQYFECKRGFDLKVIDLLVIIVLGMIPIVNIMLCLFGVFSVISYLMRDIQFFDIVLLKGKKQ